MRKIISDKKWAEYISDKERKVCPHVSINGVMGKIGLSDIHNLGIYYIGRDQIEVGVHGFFELGRHPVFMNQYGQLFVHQYEYEGKVVNRFVLIRSVLAVDFG